MTASKGEIWLVDLNPRKRNNEVGKVRPALIVQGDSLNHENGYPNIIVMPLSSLLIDGVEPLRMRIVHREKLEKDSDLLIAQIRAIDKSRLIKRLAVMTDTELRKVREYLNEILD